MNTLHHIPKVPTDAELAYLQRHYTYDTLEGKVFSYRNDCDIGHLNNHGYIVISGLLTGKGRNRKKHLRHHVIWWAHYGIWPTNLIDHDNGICTDDRIDNLVLSNTRNNPANSPRRRETGMPTGVMMTPYERYEARIVRETTKGHRAKYLGTFDTSEEAGAAYQRAKQELANGSS